MVAKKDKMNFWLRLKKPFFVLAPLADVTDEAFRLIITKYGKPDVLWTEFTSADGLCDKEGREHLKINLMFSKKERPIVAQLFSANPEKMRQASKYVASLGFDGIDINMGCPDRKIEKSGAGAALIKNPTLARQIIEAAKDGIKLSGKNIPVSVKTRLGYGNDILDSWLPELLREEVAAVTIHARTRKEMSDVPADWNRVQGAVSIRNEMKSNALIIGNGDVRDLFEAQKRIEETGADGVMLGRAIFGNPWLFLKSQKAVSVSTKLNTMVEHAKLFEKLFKGLKNFAIMKKHFKAYASGFDGAKELRIKLMETSGADEVAKITKQFLKGLK
ncbi:MAG: hypothetical protein A3H57_01675 [Candidatus Taylorbacteria bacterium RIFCSPLOWO2_02_FULL_43_11]|uniref:tRNA-dihydrouridine synthase n=1 Tax=Candidatus Taylorbacteria bacterium RIFCSPHIGHO2_02_FULL_43_32b TaxID=1802306 RepID=A0A1G2MKM2_9BACT|nr:MAG: hypothetical protein A2743_01650 [Candidatus Taylorbacteria bacterium RIFCSPHIGHO2_01_FULL_43_47]OHA23561.1 MAG: hypothetical protein A3C72_04205 [Candidatus Taylorbacteria bacterium RIFCSPHIGHO2_02_FULL_43_32b]OHA30586.1 MAG: hypothetical protein A3B08_02780 [Candidatus Taylorbacteria bacterium RIFCSPLOWO2_01_FULL_43_44]OHA36832.1 MAG: hypothetical protein A3H57_01675 [Candidatus Taylorbacteria bacterium RIFCSPLOWO2_02_FULL_43_11]